MAMATTTGTITDAWTAAASMTQPYRVGMLATPFAGATNCYATIQDE
jgi:hypothetical protein